MKLKKSIAWWNPLLNASATAHRPLLPIPVRTQKNRQQSIQEIHSSINAFICWRILLCHFVRHNHVKHESAQSECQGEANARAVHKNVQGNVQNRNQRTSPQSNFAFLVFKSQVKYFVFNFCVTEQKESYYNIKREPFKLPIDDGNDFMLTFFNPIREGWLWKQGGRYKTWKRRWFILNDGCLYYFELTDVTFSVCCVFIHAKFMSNLPNNRRTKSLGESFRSRM